MKRISVDTAAKVLTWIGATLLIVAALLVMAGIILTRGVDELARYATIAAAMTVPGLVAIVIGRMGRGQRD